MLIPQSRCEAAYQAEVNNTKQINLLMDAAARENDHATRVILQWFITEQLAEEKQAGDIDVPVEGPYKPDHYRY